VDKVAKHNYIIYIYNIAVFDYFIHSLYTVINTQRGCHTLKLKLVVNSFNQNAKSVEIWGMLTSITR